MVDGEIWRDVPSVPGILASNEGRVMHIPHREPMPKGGTRSYGGQATFGVWDKRNARFSILVHGAHHEVHRLITEAFYGPAPFDDAVAMHIDENAANNRASNLKWGTQKENLNAPGYLAYCRGRTGENSPSVKGRRNNGA